MTNPTRLHARALFSVGLTIVGLACKNAQVRSLADAGAGGPSDAAARGTGGVGAPGPGVALPDAAAEGAAAPPAPPEVDCATAAMDRGNAGCRFHAVPTPVGGERPNSCLAMYVVNPGTQPVKLALRRGATSFPLSRVARLPRGAGQALTYAPFDEQVGLPGGEVAIVFLAPGPCPEGVTPALDAPAFTDEDKVFSGTTQSFELTADRPVVAYQIVPYGGGGSQVTSATLLLPRESWGTTHFTATPPFVASFITVVAAEDGTEVSLRPSGDVGAAGGVPAIRAGTVGRMTLAAGQVARFTAALGVSGLSGSLIKTSKPVGVMGGVYCFNMPVQKTACDSAHQQLPPVEALGNEYAAVRYRNRLPAVDESVPWQLVGAVDGTALSYLPARPAGAPATLAAGQSVIFSTGDAFVVRSQDADHPFHMAGYMTGFSVVDPSPDGPWPGDPEFVNVVPTSQYLSSYVFFTDPTYPDTSLVVVRKRGADGQLADVKLGCSGAPLGGWTAVGEYQYTRVDLVTGNFQPAIPGCDNGRHTIRSDAPFSVTVWGWGSKKVFIRNEWTGAASYAYPAGAGILRANTAPPPVIE